MRSLYQICPGIALALTLAGCAAPDPLSVAERAEIGAAMSMSLVASEPEPAPAPEPAPKPQPGAVCPECRGTGKITRDGRVQTTCLACDGRGKVKAAEPAQAATPAPVRTRVVYREECDGRGRCRLVPMTEVVPQ